MFDKNKVLAELEARRCLIEQQQGEIQRQLHQILLLRQLTVSMQGELDFLRGLLQIRPELTVRRPVNGGGQADPHLGSEPPTPSSDQT